MTLKYRNICAHLLCALCLGLASPALVPASASESVMSATMTAPRAWQPRPGDEIRFRVLRQGSPFGTHAVRFEAGPGDTLIARTRVDLRAGLGPVTLFRYELNAAETWQSGELISADGELRVDGNRRSMKARREGDVLRIDGSGFSGLAPGDIIPASHWNYAQTRGSHILSTEDGELIPVKVTARGVETIEAGGRTIEARRYLMDSDIDVDLWYDETGRWVKLAFEARGQTIEYILDQSY